LYRLFKLLLVLPKILTLIPRVFPIVVIGETSCGWGDQRSGE
jgi:hypothetical protein